MFRETRGDIFEVGYGNDAVCCTTNLNVKMNGDLVMGAGVARVFALRFPSLPSVWGNRITEGRHSSGFMVERVSDYFNYAVAFPTKWNWKDPSDLSLIRLSLQTLVDTTTIMGWENVILPKPGCSNGGLDWKTQVKPILAASLDERFWVISY